MFRVLLKINGKETYNNRYKEINFNKVGLLTSSLSSRPFCGGTLVGIGEQSDDYDDLHHQIKKSL